MDSSYTAPHSFILETREGKEFGSAETDFFFHFEQNGENKFSCHMYQRGNKEHTQEFIYSEPDTSILFQDPTFHLAFRLTAQGDLIGSVPGADSSVSGGCAAGLKADKRPAKLQLLKSFSFFPSH